MGHLLPPHACTRTQQLGGLHSRGAGTLLCTDERRLVGVGGGRHSMAVAAAAAVGVVQQHTQVLLETGDGHEAARELRQHGS